MHDLASPAWNFLNALFYKPAACLAAASPRGSAQEQLHRHRFLPRSQRSLLTSSAQTFGERGRGHILRTDKGALHPHLDHADAYDLVRSLSMMPAYRYIVV